MSTFGRFALPKTTLGGGNSNIFNVHPENWGRFQFWLIFFQMGCNHQLVTVGTWKWAEGPKRKPDRLPILRFQVPTVSFTEAILGVIKWDSFWGIKQCKSMVIFEGFPLQQCIVWILFGLLTPDLCIYKVAVVACGETWHCVTVGFR